MRFYLMNYSAKNKGELRLMGYDEMNNWILLRLNETIKTTNEGFEEYKIYKGTKAIKQFWMNDLCSTYIEHIKANDSKEKYQYTLHKCITTCLKTLYPYMPFITTHLLKVLQDHSIMTH